MLIALTGRMGQGKTLGMTLLGGYFSLKNKIPLYANYTLNEIPYTKVENIEKLQNIQSGIVILDELWLTMDSRAWKDNIDMTTWLNQTRKKDLIILYTCQHISQIDVRVRRATDWLVLCVKKGRLISLNFIEYQYGMIGKKILLSNPERYYRFYNTNEYVRTLR